MGRSRVAALVLAAALSSVPFATSWRASAAARPSVAPGVGAFEFQDQGGATLDSARVHLALSRALPDSAPEADREGFRVALRGRAAGSKIDLVSLSPSGVLLDALRAVPLSLPCPAPASGAQGGDEACARTGPLRLVMDDLDRSALLTRDRSLRAEVGGRVLVVEDSRALASIPVGGPLTPAGLLGRTRVHVRAIVLRAEKNGPPGLGGTDAEALSLLRVELADASMFWGQCGITLGPPEGLDVVLASPPPPFLVALGDDLGLPSSGGIVRLKVLGKKIAVELPAGLSPLAAATRISSELSRAGFQAAVSTNARIAPGASPSADVLVRRADGTLVAVEPDGALSTDPTLTVRIGSVDLSDGLSHFGDMDSVAGTLEERTLVKALDDGDPRIVKLLVVPYFVGGKRIGESFIWGDGSSVKNVVLVDRSGVRARRSSHAVAHELGHVLLDAPGHPDDWGEDTPTALMDSDASDPSVYGPRRISIAECARVYRESGPRSKIPLLEPWPFQPVKIPDLRAALGPTSR